MITKAQETIIWRLSNTLRGRAMYVKDDKLTSDEDKLEQFKVIEDMKHYLDNYEEFQAVIEAYESSKDKESEER